jgi:hypothetical protein
MPMPIRHLLVISETGRATSTDVPPDTAIGLRTALVARSRRSTLTSRLGED